MNTIKISIILLCLSATAVLAQQQASQCAQEAGCVYVETITRNMRLHAPDCSVDIIYNILDCGNGNLSYEIVNYVARGVCEGMDSLLIYHYRLSSLEEYVSLALLQSELTLGANAPSIPGCPNGVQTIRIYSASCGIWVGCEYEVDPSTRVCDQGYDPPYPDYGVNPTKVKAYKWQPCGEVCCIATYETCQDFTDRGRLITRKVSSVPVNQCSLQSKYATPCQTGCQ